MNKKKKNSIKGVILLQRPRLRKKMKKISFSLFFVIAELRFAKKSPFGPKKRSIFPGACKTISRIYQEIKNLKEKNKLADFAKILKVVNFRNRKILATSNARKIQTKKCQGPNFSKIVVFL